MEGCQAVVLSRNPDFHPTFGQRAGSIPEALSLAKAFGREIWICGGEQIYRETLPLADRLFLTKIHIDVEGDTHFPPWENYFPNETHHKDCKDGPYKYSFHTFEK